MKKGIFIVIIAAMFAWAVYNLTFSSNQTSESDVDDLEVMAEQDATPIGLERGNRAPDFELTTLEGETVKLSDYLGKPVMLNFWATWCGPCRAEMPDMQKFHENKDVAVVAVNLTDTEHNRDNVPNFVEEYGLSFPILMDEKGEVSSLYRIQPIPTSYLLDSNGHVIHIAYGAMNYDQMVQQFENMN